MQISGSAVKSTPGRDDWFSGTVYVETVASPTGPSRLWASMVHYAPGGRTVWHQHPNGQTIYVTEGVGACQRRGGEIEIIRAGETVYFEPGEEHWHGATAERFMSHLAMLEVDSEGSTGTWGAHVSDDEYAPAKTS